ncbi:hypothetical protein HII13_004942 [Brettanomyces bruxellensis]|nr:hypothetical protein HII13_004942 [Brettanomyces bruxellensis]
MSRVWLLDLIGAILMLSVGGISVALITIDRNSVAVLSILTAFCWLYAVLSLIDILHRTITAPISHKISGILYHAMLLLKISLFLGSKAVEIYWLDHLILEMDIQHLISTSKRLQASLASVVILSAIFCSPGVYANATYMCGKSGMQDQIPDLDIKKGGKGPDANSKQLRFESDSTAAAGSAFGSSINSSLGQTVKIKDSMQTLAPDLATKCEIEQTKKSAENVFWTAKPDAVSDAAPDAIVHRAKPTEQTDSWDSGNSDLAKEKLAVEKHCDISKKAKKAEVSIPSLETAEYEDLGKPVYRFPEPISEEYDENRQAKFTFPPTQENAYMQAYEEASMGSLDNLSDIPEHSTDRWPLFSTGSGLPADNGVAGSLNKNVKMNHVSPESWKLNSDHWQRNRERVGFNNGIITSTKRIDQGWCGNDEGNAHDAISEQEQAKVDITASKNRASNLDVLDLSPPPLDTRLRKSASLSPEKLIPGSPRHHSSKLSLPDTSFTNSGLASKDSRLSLRIGGVLRNSRSIPMLRTSFNHSRSHSVLGIFSRSTPSSPKRSSPSKSVLTSPIKGIRGIRFGSRENIKHQRYTPRHCGHSQSVPELNFEFIQSLQSSPTHKKSLSSVKGHRRATSSLTYKSSPKRRALHRKDNSRLMLVEAHNETSLVVQGSDASSANSDLSTSDSLEEESLNSVPSMLIGQYDREKWRVIRRKQLSEVAL